MLKKITQSVYKEAIPASNCQIFRTNGVKIDRRRSKRDSFEILDQFSELTWIISVIYQLKHDRRRRMTRLAEDQKVLRKYRYQKIFLE